MYREAIRRDNLLLGELRLVIVGAGQYCGLVIVQWYAQATVLGLFIASCIDNVYRISLDTQGMLSRFEPR